MVVCDQLVLCKAALILAITKWLLSFALNLFLTNSNHSSSPNLKILTLTLTTIGEMEHRLPGNRDRSCAVCLDKMKKKSHVYELGNCCHVFHKQCLERWLCYDNRVTCPLCRMSLVAVSPLPMPPEQPSWAVDRMLYLFGDDLLPSF